VVITPGAGATGTATGQGNDTGFGDGTQFIGSANDDTVIVPTGVYPGGLLTGFSGGAGSDTVDASAAAAAVTIDLDALDPDAGPEPAGFDVDGYFGLDITDDVENAIGSEFNDTLLGNGIRNTLSGLGGDDTVSGLGGNDILLGGPGNDLFTGGPGADRVSFAGSANGVDVDLSLGFATGEGDDGFGDLIEIIVGSRFGDRITGGPFAGGGTVNFLLIGRGGPDVLTGFAGNDTLRGGPGKDTLRGVGGDDNLIAGGGRDTLAGGGGFDIGRGGPGRDVCRSVERRFSCGTRGNPARPAAQLAKLV
jgi:Ca2+-binding RTX toxin-like protein